MVMSGMVQIFHELKDGMLFSMRQAKLNRTYHLLPHVNFCTAT